MPTNEDRQPRRINTMRTTNKEYLQNLILATVDGKCYLAYAAITNNQLNFALEVSEGKVTQAALATYLAKFVQDVLPTIDISGCATYSERNLTEIEQAHAATVFAVFKDAEDNALTDLIVARFKNDMGKL